MNSQQSHDHHHAGSDHESGHYDRLYHHTHHGSYDASDDQSKHHKHHYSHHSGNHGGGHFGHSSKRRHKINYYRDHSSIRTILKKRHQHQRKRLQLQFLQVDEREASYKKVMLLKRIPTRFYKILGPEILMSLLLYAGVLLKVVSPIYRTMHVAVLIVFWVLMWRSARRNRMKTTQLKHYYICNLGAYGLFLLVAFVIFLLALGSEDFPLDPVYYPLFRLSLIVSLINDKHIAISEMPLSMAIFYVGTLAVLMLEPVVNHCVQRMKPYVERRERRKEERRAAFYEKNREKIKKIKRHFH